MLENFMDYELENGTDAGKLFLGGSAVSLGESRVRGDTRDGAQHGGEDFVEPHCCGRDGYAYLRLMK